MANYNFSLIPREVSKLKTKNRKIQTPIPAPGTMELLDRLKKVESRSMHGQLPIVWDKAEDFSVYDIAGNRWIDFTSTIFVANVGHSNPRIISAITDTLNHPLLSCYAYTNPIRAKYLEKLIEFAAPPFEKAFLLSAGTEATEAALKLMRMNSLRLNKRRNGIICIQNNWHGRTLGAQMMSSNLSQREWIGYQDQNIHHISFPYPWIADENNGEEFLNKELQLLEEKGIDLSQDICGFMLETFQGWGAIFYPNSFVQAIEKLCKKNNILLAFDEMQAGFGRTGRKFGFEHYQVTPDLICTGKGMGGGTPLSGVIGKAEIMDLPEIGNMSSTHSANPLVCAAGIAVLDELISKDLINEADRKGKLFRNGLEQIKKHFPDHISWILGHGMIMAVLFKNHINGEPDSLFASQVAERCMQKGVLVVHTGRESIKLGPPLTISDEALLEGITVIEESISEIANQ